MFMLLCLFPFFLYAYFCFFIVLFDILIFCLSSFNFFLGGQGRICDCRHAAGDRLHAGPPRGGAAALRGRRRQGQGRRLRDAGADRVPLEAHGDDALPLRGRRRHGRAHEQRQHAAGQGGGQRALTDGIGTPDPNPRNCVNWCF